MKRECPECSRFLPASAKSCPSCGYQIEAEKSVKVDADHGRCEWRAGGVRCHYAGSMSDSTVGGGPWYCGAHMMAARHSEHPQEAGARIVQKSQDAVPTPNYSPDARRLMALKAMQARLKAREEA
jgi:hypothetical protein